MSDEPIAYSVADACRVTSLGKTKLFELIARGRVKAVKIDGRTLIPATSLRSLIEGEAA